MLNKWMIACCISLLIVSSAFAVEKPLPDPVDEARAYALFHQVRCAACQSESLADSSADVASDMRRAIRERVNVGDSDDDIKQYLVSRYGDYVLMKPPMRPATFAMGFILPAILVIGCILIWIALKSEGGSLTKKK